MDAHVQCETVREIEVRKVSYHCADVMLREHFAWNTNFSLWPILEVVLTFEDN